MLLLVDKKENVCEKVVRDFRASFRRRKSHSLDRSVRTLPRHLERGKNLSKRFRKSCRNWATSKGIITNKDEKPAVEDANNNAKNDAVVGEDVVVIELEEDPELKHRPASTTDIGKLVSELVFEAKRNNTLPRSRNGSRWSVYNREDRISLGDKSLSATSVAAADDKQEESKEPSSISISMCETGNEDVESSMVSVSKSPVLETCFDLEDDAKEDVKETVEDSSFYNGIMLETEFLVTARYSKDQFEEKTTDSLETSQLDQSGFTDVHKVNMSDNEKEEESFYDERTPGNEQENHNDDEKCEQDGEIENSGAEQQQEVVNSNGELTDNYESEVEIAETVCEEEEEEESHDEMLDIDSDQEESSEEDLPTDITNIMLLEREKVLAIFSYEPGLREDITEIESNSEEKAEAMNNDGIEGCEGEPEVRGSHLDSSDDPDDDSENEFQSIAKISALDFLNDENEHDDDEEDLVPDQSDQFNSRYFSSSFMFSHPSIGKESSFPSLKNEMEEEASQATHAGSYLEAINLEMDRKGEGNWFNRFNTTELRVNPFYKDEDSLNSQNSLNSWTDIKQPQFNYNFQEFCDLWQMFSKEQDQESEIVTKTTTNGNIQDSTCSLLYNNLEAILEEDESEEDVEEVDTNNNYGDYGTVDDYVDMIKSASVHDNTVIKEYGNEKMDLTGNKYEKIAENECGNTTDSHIFHIEPDIFDEFGQEDSSELEDYIEKLILSIVENILEPKILAEEENSSILDEIDAGEEYYSCDSPEDDEASGISTDEGIEASEDEDDEENDEFVSGKSHFSKVYDSEAIECHRKSPTQL